MKDEITIFLMNHGRFGEEMIQSAELIIGKIERIQAISLLRGMSPEDLMRQAEEAFSAVSGPRIVLADLFGGTPSNVAMMLREKFDLHILCGINLPMLMDVVLARDTKPLAQVMEGASYAGKEAIVIPWMKGLKEKEDF